MAMRLKSAMAFGSGEAKELGYEGIVMVGEGESRLEVL